MVYYLKNTIRQYWMRNQEVDQFALISPKRMSRNATNTNPNPNPINAIMASFAKEQTHVFAALSQKCSSMEYALGAVEVLLVQMAEKVQKYNESRETEVLGSLKIKQSEFIISELRSTIVKQTKKEEKLGQELQAEKRRSQKCREQAYKAEGKSSALAEKVAQLQGTMRKKTQEIQTLTANLNKQREEDNRNRSKSMASRESLSVNRSSEEYAELEGKLQQLEREFTSEIEKLLAKNNQLCIQLKKRDDANSQLINSNKLLRKKVEEAASIRYELEIKSKQESMQLLELQESYNKLVEKSNSSEIMLHKQLQDYKVKEAEIKNEYKKEKKSFKTYLSLLAEYINGSKYYFTAQQIKDQLEELKKLYEKSIKKKLETLSRELEYSQTEYKKVKVKADELQQKMAQMQKTKGASFKELQNEERVDRNSENGSLLNNRSSDRSEEEKYRGVEEKYKLKLQALRKEIKAKQAKINELERQQQTDFQKNKQKILQLELLISEKINQIRKFDLKFKQRDYEFSEYQSRIKQLEGKLKFLAQKQQSQKESNSKLMQIKTQNYESKLKIIKNNYRQLQKKQQDKTIKYNKLKSKYQKYELQASESIKRKNAQIDQLLKENNKCKAENKLLQEKININNIIQGEISKNKETPTGVNQDLIEQIEMERDRISLALADKEKKYADLVEMNEKINRESIGVRRENRQLRNKVEEYQREERILKEQIKYAKEKIQQLTNNSQKIDEEKYSYFKKELEKSVINVKKLQKACEKYGVERQQRKKELEQKEKEITALKANVQKLKEKKRKIEIQLQQEKESGEKVVVEYDRKLSQCTTREQQLVDIINYKNRQGDGIRESMKGQELILEEEAKIKFNIDTMTDKIECLSIGINTDPVVFQSHQKHTYDKPIIPSEMILGNEFLLDDSLEKQHKKSTQQPKIKENPPQLNFFGDLVAENDDDHFDICEQGDEELIQKVSSNLQLKETFNTLRQTIQKLFNEDDISVSTVKLLPKHLQDDFNDFISYIKEKIREIKDENNLTFIMAEAGNEPSDVDSVLQEFLAKPSPEFMKMRKIIEEKDNLITSLMNEKTQQENTITQQQNMQEQIQRLHLQQYSVLKGQIHEQKHNIDKQLLYYQSLKNILKKMMNFWIQDQDNYDDFQDNLHLITTIYKFNPKQLELLKLYLKKYKELKQIQ